VKNREVKEKHEVKGLFWLSIVAYAGAEIWFLTICCIRKRIALAISSIKEASNVMSAMPIIILSLLFQIIGICAFLIPFGVFMTHLASSGEVKAECICLAIVLQDRLATEKHFGTGPYQVFVFSQVDEEAIGRWIPGSEAAEQDRGFGVCIEFVAESL